MHNVEDSKPSEPSRRGLLSFALVASAAASGLPLILTERATAEDAKIMLMFVQLSEGLKVDEAAKTIRLVNVSPHTLYFADRPERIAGHIKMPAFLEEWTSKAGADNFGRDPPNAALSVYEEGQPNNTLAVVEITDPKLDGHDIVYGYKLIDGKLPAGGGETSLFIDWIGPGGGVGFGFHGVGVGLRGPGLR
jgi:hypothetical protein